MKRVRVQVERGTHCIVVVTSPDLPEWSLITTADRLDRDVPGSIEDWYRVRHARDVVAVPDGAHSVVVVS